MPTPVRISARSENQRGNHFSFSHPLAFEICQALSAEGVIGDFSAPDVVRFGVTLLYLGFEVVWLAIERLAAILREENWRDPRYNKRAKAT